jgi:Serine carboxypeptidase
MTAARGRAVPSMDIHDRAPAISRRSAIAGAGAMLVALTSGARETTPVAGVSPTAITHGKVTIRGRVIRYRAEAGETVMHNAAGVARATMFSVSYLARGGGGDARRRPVTFIYNGGPGGATWPLRNAIAPSIIGRADAPPGFAFVENPDSLIDVSDLVFIDAPGTGYSRFLSGDAKAEYWGIQQDGRAFATFIVGWLRAHGRMSSPKYLLGESYGGTRTGQVLEMLALRAADPVTFAGVTLISPTLGTGTESVFSVVSNGPVTLVPSEAVAAWYNRRDDGLSETLEQIAGHAQNFAAGRYAGALERIDRLDGAGKRAIAHELSSLIGIAPETILQSGLSVPIPAFRKLLLAGEGEVLGEDSRKHHPRDFKPPLLDSAAGYDLSAAIIAMVRVKLGYRTSQPYLRNPVEAQERWNNTITSGRRTLPAILEAVTAAHSGFGIFLAGGYFDLIVPYFLPLSALTAAHLPAARFVHRLYPTGHEVLNDVVARAAAVGDVRAFYRSSP